MSEEPLGELTKVDLREYWRSEAAAFTPWLAQPRSIKALGDALGLELEVEAQEQDIGRFRADIVCREVGRERRVLIENQLEPTDHGHLGQILTYAAGLDATAVIWIAERFGNEHRAALDWLNEVTDEDRSFFGVEIELWRIGNSLAAPRFNVVCKPNEWSREVQVSARAAATPTKQLQLDFWTGYRDYLSAHSTLRCQRPGPQHWMTHTIGRSGCRLVAVLSTWDDAGSSAGGQLRAELILDDRHAKSYFGQLLAQRAQIEAELGVGLDWHNPADARMCRIFERRSAVVEDRSCWTEYYEWLRSRLEAFDRAFRRRVRELRGSEQDEAHAAE